MVQRYNPEKAFLPSSPFAIAVQKSETDQIDQSAEARFLPLKQYIEVTKTGFIWRGNDVQYINPNLFDSNWLRKPSVESKIAIELDKKLIRYVGFTPPGDYFISSSETGRSLQYEGFWLAKGQQYYIRKI